MTTPTVLSVPAFAEHIGCKRHYGYELKKDGRLVMAADGKNVLVAESIARIAATRDPAKQGVADRHAQERGAHVITGHSDAAVAATQADAQGDDQEDDAADPVPGSLYNFQDAKAKREYYAAEREHTAFLKEAGELMESTEVVKAFATAGTILRSKLESWQATLPAQLMNRDEAGIRAILADQTERILHDISNTFGRLAEEAD